MAGPLRIEYPGAVCHVTARVNARKRMYKDDANRRLSFVKHDYTWNEIAEYLGIHYPIVSNV